MLLLLLECNNNLFDFELVKGLLLGLIKALILIFLFYFPLIKLNILWFDYAEDPAWYIHYLAYIWYYWAALWFSYRRLNIVLTYLNALDYLTT